MSMHQELDDQGRAVQEQQRAVAAWMRSVMAEKNLLPTNWAIAAGLSRSTVNRAIKEDYRNISTTKTLLLLAKAAGVPPPIDLGRGDTAIPSSQVLGAILVEMLRIMVPRQKWDDELALPLGRAMRQSLLEMATEAEQEGDLMALARKTARMAARLQRREDDIQESPESD